MKRFIQYRITAVAFAGLLMAAALPGECQQKTQEIIMPQPVAETNLLMQGMANANFRGLNQNLKIEPADQQKWVFARGQALLIAECGNLLMLRPPKNEGRQTWMERCVDLRKAATKLAYNLSKRDYAESRKAMVQLANACNACHQNFRIDVEAAPFPDK